MDAYCCQHRELHLANSSRLTLDEDLVLDFVTSTSSSAPDSALQSNLQLQGPLPWLGLKLNFLSQQLSPKSLSYGLIHCALPALGLGLCLWPLPGSGHRLDTVSSREAGKVELGSYDWKQGQKEKKGKAIKPTKSRISWKPDVGKPRQVPARHVTHHLPMSIGNAANARDDSIGNANVP